MTSFRALRVEAQPDSKHYELSIQQRQVDDLPQGELLVRVAYSSLNFKDALSANGNKGVTRQYPHTPGIDAAGVIEISTDDRFKPGDKVIITGYDLGMNTSGGFAEYVRVPASWAIHLPEGMTLRQSMVFGTAGLTAALCVNKLLNAGLTPDQGDVLVTGATGGVGSISVALLSKLGFNVVASSGKEEQHDFLKSLGAERVIDREAVTEGTGKLMLREQWAGAVDSVGGEILFNIIKSLKYGSSVACCGLVASPNFQASVFPFILRGVNLLGVDSVELPLSVKEAMWKKLSEEWSLDLEALTQEVTLEQLPESIETIFKGQLSGRVVVNLNS